jgi:hypothetical protein
VISRSRVQVIIAIAVVVWGALLFAEGVDLTPQLLHPFSAVVGSVVLVLTVYEQWIWRLPWLRWLPGRPPRLYGTWAGTLTSTYGSIGSTTPVPPIQVFLTVTQSASALSMNLLTAESRSRSLTCALDESSPDSWVASSTYINTPQLLVQDRSRIHHGSMVLNLHGSPPHSLDGAYWTDRDTKGQIELSSWSPRKHNDFASAQADPAFAHPPADGS